MSREYLPAAQRKEQILDAAQRLFITQGYTNTTIDDILQSVGIAKGTLYHHFSSKEQILEAVVIRAVSEHANRAWQVAEKPGAPLDKLFLAIRAARADLDDLKLAEELHVSGNAELHLLSIVESVRQLTPPLTQIVNEGCADGSFKTPYPEQTVEMILLVGNMLLDDGVFPASEELSQQRFMALMHGAARLLGCSDGTVALAVRHLS